MACPESLDEMISEKLLLPKSVYKEWKRYYFFRFIHTMQSHKDYK
jgi:hypothetical protein